MHYQFFQYVPYYKTKIWHALSDDSVYWKAIHNTNYVYD
jgi:hypothetical protein